MWFLYIALFFRILAGPLCNCQKCLATFPTAKAAIDLKLIDASKECIKTLVKIQPDTNFKVVSGPFAACGDSKKKSSKGTTCSTLSPKPTMD